MNTKLISAYDDRGEIVDLSEAAQILREGGLVAIPTETVYGLAADALNGDAAAKIFAAKGRPQDNPLIVHISDLEMLDGLVKEFPEPAFRLAQKFWPGPLTIILPKTDKVPPETSGGLGTVAVRMPSHPVARRIIALTGKPLAAPSANLSGSPSPTTAQHCVHDLLGRVDAIVDGGECGFGVESTVITLAQSPPRLLRPGAVTFEQLKGILPDIKMDPAVKEKLEQGVTAASPGMKYRHYAPKAKVVLVDSDLDSFTAYAAAHQNGKTVALCFEGEDKIIPLPCVVYGKRQDPLTQAQHLFDCLRQLDDMGAQMVYARCPSQEGIGLAVYNRLIRAAEFEVVRL